MAKDQFPSSNSTMSTVIPRHARTVSFAPVMTRDLPRTIRHAAFLSGHRNLDPIITEALTRALDLDLGSSW